MAAMQVALNYSILWTCYLNDDLNGANSMVLFSEIFSDSRIIEKWETIFIGL